MSGKHREELERIFDALAESVLEATDEEIQDEMRQEGLEPAKVAEVTRSILLDAATSFEKRKLREARQAYERRRAEITEGRHRLLDFAEERRNLFMRLLALQPQLSAALTLQYRDFQDFTDDEIESLLEQIQVLGLLDGQE